MNTRRTFLKTTGAGLTILPSLRVAQAYEANERLNLAIFGTMYNASSMLAAPHTFNAPIVALCDPDQRRIEKAKKRWHDTANRLRQAKRPEDRKWAEHFVQLAAGKDVKIYSEIRRLLDEMDSSIDALVVSNYDHFHGVSCGPALRAGKPVLSERPLGLNISDARQLRALAAETKLPTTYRSPGTASGQFRRAMELLKDGAIGEVKEVHIWFKRGGPNRKTLPQGPQPIPNTLNWNAWLGPLPMRDYHQDWMTYATWRETCNGGLGSFGPHTTIFPFMVLQLRKLWDRPEDSEPVRVTAECSNHNPISFPTWERVQWQIPARDKLPPLTITWHHGNDYAPGARELIHEKLRHFGITDPVQANDLMRMAGSLIVGEKGAFLGSDHSTKITFLPESKFVNIETNTPKRIPASSNIYAEWIKAIRGQKHNIIANFSNGGPLSELLMLGNIATLHPEETLSYNPTLGRITNHSTANNRLGIDYRHGWSL